MSGAGALQVFSQPRRPVTGPANATKGFVARLLRKAIDASADHIVPVRPLRAADVSVLPCSAEAAIPRIAHEIHAAPATLAEAYARQGVLPISPPPAALGLCSNATVSAGVVQLADGTAIAESLINTGADFSFTPFRKDEADRLRRQRRRFARVRRLGDKPYVLLKQRWDSNYGHWLVEALPRLACVEEHYSLDELGFIVSGHHGPMQAIYEQSLALFGIRRHQIVEAGDETLKVDRLIYPAPVSEHPWHFSPRCLDVLERLATRARLPLDGPSRVYVTRNRMTRRCLLNEDAVLAAVRRRGFTVMAPETMSLYEQIAAFRNARVVVGGYGAALTNAVFAAGDVALFALTSAYMQDDFFSTLMSLKGARYLSLHGPSAGGARDPNADFSIDVARFERLLDGLLASRASGVCGSAG